VSRWVLHGAGAKVRQAEAIGRALRRQTRLVWKGGGNDGLFFLYGPYRCVAVRHWRHHLVGGGIPDQQDRGAARSAGTGSAASRY